MSMAFHQRLLAVETTLAELLTSPVADKTKDELVEQVAMSVAMKAAIDERLEDVFERLKKLEDRTARTLAYEKSRAAKNG